MRVVLTAGFDRALHAVALAELARREGHTVAAVLVVSVLRASRVRQIVLRRGARSLFDAFKRIAASPDAGSTDALVREFLERRGVRQRSLGRWCREHGVPLQVVPDLNAPQALELLRGASFDGVLYAGGGILRSQFLAAARGRVLNAHSGPLPHVRGMNACEWSLLLGRAPSVTIHTIDEGIDTGGVLDSIAIEVAPGDSLATLRAKCVIAGIEGLTRALRRLAGPLPTRAAAAGASRQCFTLAPVLRELLEARLAERGPRA